MITKEQLEKEKLSLHLKYISIIAFMCICLVIILSFCEDSMFKSCVSVSSTVTSIILSVIAIILSVTGERTTNEIRDKVSDSVKQLECCTDKSSMLAEELSSTIKQMNSLYKNVNDKIIDEIPQIKESLNSFLATNMYNNDSETNLINNIVKFLNVVAPEIKQGVKKSFNWLLNSTKEHPITPGDILQNLIDDGYDVTTGTVAMGLMIGYITTGALNVDSINKIINRL